MRTLEHRGALIAVLGVTGAGKSTFTQHLAHELPADVFIEQTDSNPFMEAAHTTDGKIYQSQVWFLLQAVKHLEWAQMRTEAGSTVVLDTFRPYVDFHSQMTLDKRSYNQYRDLSELLTAHLSSPDLVIVLKASNALIMTRLRLRNYFFDQNVTKDFIDRLAQLQDEWIRTTPIPVMEVPSIELENSKRKKLWVEKIRETIQS